jgi:hypothetical protein
MLKAPSLSSRKKEEKRKKILAVQLPKSKASSCSTEKKDASATTETKDGKSCSTATTEKEKVVAVQAKKVQ